MTALSMSEPYEAVGKWWRVPGGDAAPDVDGPIARHGTVRFDPQQGIRLEIIDAANEFEFAAGDMATIHGQLIDGRPASLLQCREVRRSFHAGGSRIELAANTLLAGVHVPSLGELCVSEVAVGIDRLREMLAAPGLNPAIPPHPPATDELRRWTVSVPDLATPDASAAAAPDFNADTQLEVEGPPDSGSAVLSDQPTRTAQITFWLGWNTHINAMSECRELAAGVSIKVDHPLSADDWADRWLRPLQNLVGFATRSPALLTSVNFVVRDSGSAEAVHPVIRHAASDAYWEREDVYLLRRQPIRQNKQSAAGAEPLIGPCDCDFKEFVVAFFALHRQLRRSAAFLFGALNDPTGFLETRLQSLTSATEAFHRTHYPEKPLADVLHGQLKSRMLAVLEDEHQRRVYRSPIHYANAPNQRKRFLALAERGRRVMPELVEDPQRMANQIVDSRNLFTHLDEEGPDAVDGPELLDLVHRLEMLMRLHVLLACDIAHETTAALTRRAHPDAWLR